MIWLWFILLFLHVVCCILAFLGIGCGILNVHKYMFFVVLFLPFWGFALVLILHFQIAFNADDAREIQVEKMQLDSELYKGVTVENRKNNDSIIPMEEALIINSAHERRELIMDVLNDNPKEYIEFLQKAGNNDDTEVVHYAVTAMVEISKENDFLMQQMERRYAAHPDDFDVLSDYCELLWSCLQQNLMQGQVEVMNRNFFADLVSKKLDIQESSEDYRRLVINYFKLKNYTQAGIAIEKMEKFDPDSEELLLIKIEYYAMLGRGDMIKKLLEEIENTRRYLSAGAKEAIAFWTA